MSDHGIISDQEPTFQPASGKVSWFAGGALAVAAAIGLFLYADGYFLFLYADGYFQETLPADTPQLIIEGN